MADAAVPVDNDDLPQPVDLNVLQRRFQLGPGDGRVPQMDHDPTGLIVSCPAGQAVANTAAGCVAALVDPSSPP